MLAKHRPLHPTSILKDGAEYTQASAVPAILSFLGSRGNQAEQQ